MRTWSVGRIVPPGLDPDGEMTANMHYVEINAVGDGHNHTAKIVVNGSLLDDLIIAQEIVAALNEREAGRPFAVPVV